MQVDIRIQRLLDRKAGGCKPVLRFLRVAVLSKIETISRNLYKSKKIFLNI